MACNGLFSRNAKRYTMTHLFHGTLEIHLVESYLITMYHESVVMLLRGQAGPVQLDIASF